jgi:hypothetical protein
MENLLAVSSTPSGRNRRNVGYSLWKAPGTAAAAQIRRELFMIEDDESMKTYYYLSPLFLADK